MSATACTVVGETTASSGIALATTNDGSTWTTESTPAAGAYSGIACPAIGACTAVGWVSDLGGGIIIGQSQITSVLLPSNGATVSNNIWLDAVASSPVGVASVRFEVSGGSVTDKVVSSAVSWVYGWLGAWDTTDVPNGTYTIQSVATDALGRSTTSAGITVTVNNLPLQTAVLVPSDGATLSGSAAVLDASATGTSDVTSVQFEVSGGTLSDDVVATAMPTLYGWIAEWNTTAVPSGTYTLQSVATEVGSTTATSPGIAVTVAN